MTPAGSPPPNRSPAEGEIVVRLEVARGSVARVQITQSRPFATNSAFAGRSADEVRRLLPTLFTVCRIAHSVAFNRALEAGAGDAKTDAARDALCFAEAAVSHVWQFALGWREAAGVPPDALSVGKARRALAELSSALFGRGPVAGALLPSPDWEAASQCLAVLEKLVRGYAGGESPLEAAVVRSGASDFGQATTRRAASLPRDAALAFAVRPRDFLLSPELLGEPVDVSALARAAPPSPEVAGGLLTRLAARRAVALADMADAVANLEAARGSMKDEEHLNDGAFRSVAMRPGEAVGQSNTARGPLLHWVRNDGEVVQEHVSLAPTDWTFHPAGVVSSALTGAPADSIERDATWLVLALDPCIPFRIEVVDA